LQVTQLVDVKQVLLPARVFLHADKVLVAADPHGDSPSNRFTGSGPHVVITNGAGHTVEEIQGPRISVHRERRTIGKDL
jgi:hypothetical protein